MPIKTGDFYNQEKGNKLVRITLRTFIKGELAEPGDVFSVPISDYKVLIGAEKAVDAGPGAKVGKAPPTSTSKDK